MLAVVAKRGKLFYLQLELLSLQLSFSAYNPFRPYLTHFPTVSHKAPTVSRKAKIVSKKLAKLVN